MQNIQATFILETCCIDLVMQNIQATFIQETYCIDSVCIVLAFQNPGTGGLFGTKDYQKGGFREKRKVCVTLHCFVDFCIISLTVYKDFHIASCSIVT